MQRASTSRIGSIAAVLLLVGSAVFVSSLAFAESTAKVEKVKGALILNQEAGTGTATGSFKGIVTIAHIGNDLTGTYGLRFIDELVITRPDGSTIELTMDYLGTNFTTPALTGGGLAVNTTSPGVGEPWYSLTVYMTPGENYPEQVWAYDGVMGVTE